MEVHERTPADVQLYLCDTGNEWNGIVSTVTFLELLERSEEARKTLTEADLGDEEEDGEFEDVSDHDAAEAEDDDDEGGDQASLQKRKKRRLVLGEGVSGQRTAFLKTRYPSMWSSDFELRMFSVAKATMGV